MKTDNVDLSTFDEYNKVHFCKICGERIDKNEFSEGEAVYYKEVGSLHTKHKGVKEWYDKMLCKEQDNYIEKINNKKLEHEKIRMEKLAKEV